MNWVYYGKLYTSKFQAGCFAKRLEQDGWLFGYHDPRMVEVYRSKRAVMACGLCLEEIPLKQYLT